MRQNATVYRVERENGTGPYRSVTCYSDFHREFDSGRHPLPSTDGIDDPYGELFGFPSKRLFRRWFNEQERERLAEHDFKLSVYSVPKEHVRRGSKQCVFKPENAKLMRTEALA
jgi:hypothetical protein